MFYVGMQGAGFWATGPRFRPNETTLLRKVPFLARIQIGFEGGFIMGDLIRVPASYLEERTAQGRENAQEKRRDESHRHRW
jgi:hypothetical protein